MPPKDKIPQFSEDSPQIISTRNVAVPLWLSASITTALVSATVYFMAMLNQINSKLDNLSGDRWKKSHQREFANMIQNQNPSMRIPNIDEISQRLDK